jgi:hypothetical protein
MDEAALPPPVFPHHAHADGKLVWLASYPKSGNTWTRLLISNFLREPAEDTQDTGIAPVGTISSNRAIFDEAAGLPSSDLTHSQIDLLRPAAYRRFAAQASGHTIYLKTHDAFQRNAAGQDIFPADCSRGTILIVRHPMDVAFSYTYHLGDRESARAVSMLGNPAHTMAGESKRQLHQLTMGWSGHYLSWTRQDAIPVLVVRYEDMLADTARQFTRMLAFLGVAGADDRARVENAVALSRFDRLQGIEARNGFREIPVRAERFFRSGRAGEGIERLPAKLRQRILMQHGPVMAELGYSQDGTCRL